MTLIGSDFVAVFQKKRTRCSECQSVIETGEAAFESIRDGKCKKRVCSERCRLAFDDAFWQAAAQRNHPQEAQ